MGHNDEHAMLSEEGKGNHEQPPFSIGMGLSLRDYECVGEEQSNTMARYKGAICRRRHRGRQGLSLRGRYDRLSRRPKRVARTPISRPQSFFGGNAARLREANHLEARSE